MKRNFNELFSKMKPEAQARVKARSCELLQEMAVPDPFGEVEGATEPEDAITPSTDANATSSGDATRERATANRKVAMHGSK